MIKRILSSQLRINMFSGVATTIVNSAALAIAYPLYLHFLGYEKYGVWLVLATVLTFAQLGNLGIDQAVMKLVAEEYGRNNIEGIQRYVTTAIALLCISGTTVLTGILALQNQIIALFKLNDENARMVLWLLPYISILSIYVFIVHVLNAVLSGLGRMDLANYIQSVSKIMTVVVAAILLYNGRGIESLLIASTLSYVFIHVASLICIWRIANIRFLQIANLNIQRGKHILSFCGAAFGGSLINMLFSPFNKLMLSRYAGVASIPVYEIAFTGSMQIRGLIVAGLRPLMPEISRIGGSTTRYVKDRIFQIYRRAMKFVFLSGVPLYAGLIIAAPLLLRVWLGDRFVETLPGAFRIMLIGTFLSLLGVPAYYTLMGIGYVRHNLVSHIVQSIVNIVIVLGVLIASTVSAATVVWSSSIAMAGSTLYLILQKKRVFQHVGNNLYQSGTNKENVETALV